jgi:hypothetical protein
MMVAANITTKFFCAFDAEILKKKENQEGCIDINSELTRKG